MSVAAPELRQGDRIRAVRSDNSALVVEGFVQEVRNHDLKIGGIDQWFVGHCWHFILIKRAIQLPSEAGWYIRQSSGKSYEQGSTVITIWRLSPKEGWSYSAEGRGWVRVEPDVVPTSLVRLVPQENSDGC